MKDKEEKVEKEEVEGENKDEKVAVEGEQAAETKEEPAKEELTLDEYLAKRKGKAPVVAALQPRTVNADDFNAAGLVPLQRGEAGEAPLNPKKKSEKAATKEEKPAASAADKKKEENLAAKLLTFATHQDEKRRESRSYRNDNRQGGDRRGPRPPRGPRNDAKGAAAAASSQVNTYSLFTIS